MSRTTPETTDRADTAESDARPVLLRVSPGLCEGWGECHRFASEIYPLGPDGKVDVHVLEVPAEDAARARRAAALCPVRAIQCLDSVGTPMAGLR